MGILKTIAVFLSGYLALLLLVILGELFTQRFPNTRFARWWRREIIGILPADDPMF